MKCSAAVSFFFKEGKILIVRFNNKHDHSTPAAKKITPTSNTNKPPTKKKEKDTHKNVPFSQQASEADSYDKMKLKMKVARIYGLNYYKDIEEP